MRDVTKRRIEAILELTVGLTPKDSVIILEDKIRLGESQVDNLTRAIAIYLEDKKEDFKKSIQSCKSERLSIKSVLYSLLTSFNK